jgi:hypothetical protein
MDVIRRSWPNHTHVSNQQMKRPSMTENKVLISIMGAVLLGTLAAAAAISAQDKYTVKVPNGLAFSEFKGYEDWQSVAVSVTEQASSPSWPIPQ